MSDSIESKALKLCTAQVQTALMNKDVILKLYIKDFIPENVCDKVLYPITILTPTGELMRHIARKIKCDPLSFHKLLSIFTETGRANTQIILSEKYEELLRAAQN